MTSDNGPEWIDEIGALVNALLETWNAMDRRRRGLLAGGVVALVLVLIILTRLASQPSYALLYSGLDPAAAGDVVEAVSTRGIAHRIDGDSIFVDATERDALRLALASDGLPANGPQGYELLDTLSGFGTTSQMFDAAYWRAKEGELARTILASPSIRAARVHIANPSSDPFQPTQEVTASVAIRPAAGGLAPGHAQALRYLVASSVPGLSPDNITVIDADSGRVLGTQDHMSPTADASARAEELRQNVERLLAARVGPGNAVVQVAVELETARETVLERVIDPESRVIVATETEEADNATQDGAAAGVTVASNLPEGDAVGGEGSSAQSTESRERVTFDLSELQREVEREPGAIRRITVAVLLNGVEQVGQNGIVETSPRPAEEIEALSVLVRSAVGYDAVRGDMVTIQSMAFDEAAITDLAEPGFADRLNLDIGRIVQTMLLSGVAVVIVFGLIRPILAQATVWSTKLPPLEPEGIGFQHPDGRLGPSTSPLAITTDAAGGGGATQVAQQKAENPQQEQPSDQGDIANHTLPMMSEAMSDATARKLENMDPVERLRMLIEEREEETIQILRSWMNEEDEVSR